MEYDLTFTEWLFFNSPYILVACGWGLAIAIVCWLLWPSE